ncbi:Uncharacterised protein [Achromobacter xylosoxidans]|nr:Uncharacterised protein [Achromobacter xylosoxidans]
MRPKQRITAATVVASRQYLRRRVRRQGQPPRLDDDVVGPGRPPARHIAGAVDDGHRRQAATGGQVADPGIGADEPARLVDLRGDTVDGGRFHQAGMGLLQQRAPERAFRGRQHEGGFIAHGAQATGDQDVFSRRPAAFRFARGGVQDYAFVVQAGLEARGRAQSVVVAPFGQAEGVDREPAEFIQDAVGRGMPARRRPDLAPFLGAEKTPADSGQAVEWAVRVHLHDGVVSRQAVDVRG